jgi:hypothetical protein
MNWETGQHDSQTADISSLLSGLGHTTGNNILDLIRLYANSVRQAAQSPGQ